VKKLKEFLKLALKFLALGLIWVILSSNIILWWSLPRIPQDEKGEKN